MNLGAGQPASLPYGVEPQWWYSSMQFSSPLQQSDLHSSACYHPPPPGNYPPPPRLSQPNHYPPPRLSQPNHYPPPQHSYDAPPPNPYPPPLHFAQPNSYPPPQQNYTATLINGLLFPHQFPYVSQTHAQSFQPPPYAQPIYPISQHPTHHSLPSFGQPPIADLRQVEPNPQLGSIPLQLDRVSNSEVSIVDSRHSSFQFSDAKLDEFMESMSRVLDSCISTCMKGIGDVAHPTQMTKSQSSEPRVCSPLRRQPTVKPSSLLLDDTISAQSNHNPTSLGLVSGTSSNVPNFSFIMNIDCGGTDYVPEAKLSGVDIIFDDEKRSCDMKVMDSGDGKKFSEHEGISVKLEDMQGPFSCECHALKVFDKTSKSDGFCGDRVAALTSIRDKGGGLTTHCEFSNATHISVGSFLQLPAKNIVADHLICKPSLVYDETLGLNDDTSVVVLSGCSEEDNFAVDVTDELCVGTNSIDVIMANRECALTSVDRLVVEVNPSRKLLDGREVNEPRSVTFGAQTSTVVSLLGVPDRSSDGIYEHSSVAQGYIAVLHPVRATSQFRKHPLKQHLSIGCQGIVASVQYGIPSIHVLPLNEVTGYKSHLSMMELPACTVKDCSFVSKIVITGSLCKRLKKYIEGSRTISHYALQLCFSGFDKKVRDKGSGHPSLTYGNFVFIKELTGNMKLLWCIGYILCTLETPDTMQKFGFKFNYQNVLQLLSFDMSVSIMEETSTSLDLLQHEYHNDLVDLKVVIPIPIARIQLHLSHEAAEICEELKMMILASIIPGGLSASLFKDICMVWSYLGALKHVQFRLRTTVIIVMDKSIDFVDATARFPYFYNYRSIAGIPLYEYLSNWLLEPKLSRFALLTCSSELGNFLLATLLFDRGKRDGNLAVMLALFLEKECRGCISDFIKHSHKNVGLYDDQVNAFVRPNWDSGKCTDLSFIWMDLSIICLHGPKLSVAMTATTSGLLQLNVSGDDYVLGKANLALEEREQLWILNVNFKYIKIPWTSKLNGGCITGGEMYRSGAIDQLASLSTEEVLMITCPDKQVCRWLLDFQFSMMVLGIYMYDSFQIMIAKVTTFAASLCFGLDNCSYKNNYMIGYKNARESVWPGCAVELMKFDTGSAAAILGASKAFVQIKPSGLEVHCFAAGSEKYGKWNSYEAWCFFKLQDSKMVLFICCVAVLACNVSHS